MNLIAEEMRTVFLAAMAYQAAHDGPVVIDATSYQQLLEGHRAMEAARDRSHSALIEACRSYREDHP